MSSPHLVCLITLSHCLCHGGPDLACPKSTIPYLSSLMSWLAATGDCMFTSHLAWSRPIVCLLGCSPYQGGKYCPDCLGGVSCLWFKGLQRVGWAKESNHDCIMEMAKFQWVCKLQSQCSHKPGLVKMYAKQNKLSFAGKVITYQRVKSKTSKKFG